jgi:BirA family transcriptional regulator, biotin operon repressor / biotin---[acetyl-CoA-carboxylase] ligase
MDLAWHLHAQGRLQAYAWVVAGTQARGRGRLGRQWISGPGNLAATLRLPDAAADLGPLLSMATALPLVRGLAALGVPARIKWPNDIVIGIRKVGGILIEEKQGTLMAGIGMNIRTAPAHSATEPFFSLPAGCLNDAGVNRTPFELWELFLTCMLERFPVMRSDQKKTVKEVNMYLAWKQKTVVLKDTGTQDSLGRIMGIDLRGRLAVRTPKGISHVCSGTIFPRVT